MVSWIVAATLCIIISITPWLINRWWKASTTTGKLPPGSSGWPVVGETFQFFKPYFTSDIQPFVKERMKRYGPLFRTNLLGTPMIVSTDPEFNYFIFQQEGTLFESWFPYSFTQIFGEQNLSRVHGFVFKFVKNMVLGLFGPESIKKMTAEVEEAVVRELHRWSNQDTVDVTEGVSRMIFGLSAKKLISHDAENSPENLRDHFTSFISGLLSFPISIPGTPYHRCLQGRKNAINILKSMLKERRAKPRKQNRDFFDCVLEELSREKTVLTEAMALDLIFVLLFASYETTSIAMTLAIQFLTDHPSVLQKLTEEHEEIVRQRSSANSRLTWTEVKSMKYTFQVVKETLRLGNIAPVIFRKVLKDVSSMGYTIPAGWIVMVSPIAVHLNPTKFENPLEFDPSRWEVSKGSDISGTTKNFMAFGGGMRLCVGAEFSKLKMVVCLHHLVTKYRWEAIRRGRMVRTPGLRFPEGYHIRLYKKDVQKEV